MNICVDTMQVINRTFTALTFSKHSLLFESPMGQSNQSLSLPDITAPATATATRTRESLGRSTPLRRAIPMGTGASLAARPAAPGGPADGSRMRIQTVTSQPEREGPRVRNNPTTSLCSPGEAAPEAQTWTLAPLLRAPSPSVIPREALIMRALARALEMNLNRRDPTMRPQIGAQNMGQMIVTRFYFTNKLHLGRKLF